MARTKKPKEVTPAETLGSFDAEAGDTKAAILADARSKPLLDAGRHVVGIRGKNATDTARRIIGSGYQYQLFMVPADQLDGIVTALAAAGLQAVGPADALIVSEV